MNHIDISILDWIGKVHGGVTVLLNLKMGDVTYDIVYWIHPNGQYRIVFDKNFMERFNIEDIYKQPHLNKLIFYIDHKILPTREEIWSEYGIDFKEEKESY